MPLTLTAEGYDKTWGIGFNGVPSKPYRNRVRVAKAGAVSNDGGVKSQPMFIAEPLPVGMKGRIDAVFNKGTASMSINVFFDDWLEEYGEGKKHGLTTSIGCDQFIKLQSIGVQTYESDGTRLPPVDDPEPEPTKCCVVL